MTLIDEDEIRVRLTIALDVLEATSEDLREVAPVASYNLDVAAILLRSVVQAQSS